MKAHEGACSCPIAGPSVRALVSTCVREASTEHRWEEEAPIVMQVRVSVCANCRFVLSPKTCRTFHSSLSLSLIAICLSRCIAVCIAPIHCVLCSSLSPTLFAIACLADFPRALVDSPAPATSLRGYNSWPMQARRKKGVGSAK